MVFRINPYKGLQIKIDVSILCLWLFIIWSVIISLWFFSRFMQSMKLTFVSRLVTRSILLSQIKCIVSHAVSPHSVSKSHALVLTLFSLCLFADPVEFTDFVKMFFSLMNLKVWFSDLLSLDIILWIMMFLFSHRETCFRYSLEHFVRNAFFVFKEIIVDDSDC